MRHEQARLARQPLGDLGDGGKLPGRREHLAHPVPERAVPATERLEREDGFHDALAGHRAANRLAELWAGRAS